VWIVWVDKLDDGDGDGGVALTQHFLLLRTRLVGEKTGRRTQVHRSDQGVHSLLAACPSALSSFTFIISYTSVCYGH
jgi:hypothetical protein